MPIQLSRFYVSSENGINKIQWQTLSEKNSDYFDVERSENEKPFAMIERIKSAGNSSILMNYQVYDHHAGRSSTCYRLKEVDVNGSFDYSEAKCVSGTTSSSITVTPTIINSENIKIDFGENNFTQVQIMIIDFSGKIVYDQKVNNNTLTIRNEDAGFHQSGIYFIRMIADEKILDTKKLVVL